MVGQRGGIEVLGVDLDPAQVREFAGHRGHQRLGSRFDCCQCCGGIIRSRNDSASNVLGQRLDQSSNQIDAHTGDQPVEADRLKLREQADRDVRADAVVVLSRLELVSERKLHVALAPSVRVLAAQDGSRVGVDHRFRCERQQTRILAPLGLPPLVEMLGGYGFLADTFVVELVESFVVDEDVAAARAVLEFLDVVEQCTVLVEELVVRLPFALHERMADEEIARGLGIDS